MSERFIRRAVTGLGVILSLAGPARAASVRADFNGDGFADWRMESRERAPTASVARGR
jgi:hypothetical protein